MRRISHSNPAFVVIATMLAGLALAASTPVLGGIGQSGTALAAGFPQPTPVGGCGSGC